MATVNGHLVDALSYAEGFGESSTGRFVTHNGAAALLGATSGRFFLSARGVDGNVYRWVSNEISFSGAPAAPGGYADASPSLTGSF